VLGAVALASGTAAIAYVSHREQDNRFCIACHLPEGKRLHGELFDRYAGNPPVNLSALHKTKKETKCIDCHGGVGVVGRGRVILLSAKDALLYVAGRFKEPERMTSPLWDLDCVKCHADYNVGAFPEEGQAGGRDFHKHPDHRRLPLACVDCHTSHVSGDPRFRFLNNDVVLPLCQRCHKEMGKEQYAG
jgi:predicted CXXCH cytochrome family protein